MATREPELYKDKIEVSLDGRQIFYLFFGGAVIVGLVFVLGVMVGRRVEARGHVDHARTHAAADPLAALDRLESGKPALSFQRTLTGSPAVAAVDREIEDRARAREQASADEDAGEKPGEKFGKKHGKKREKQSGEKREKQSGEKHEKKREKSAERASEEKPEKMAEKTAERKAEKEREKESGDGSDEKPVTRPDQVSEKRFTLQLSSFQDRREADAFLASVKAAGYPAYVTEAEVGGSRYYRVRYGNYRSMDAANEAKSGIERAINKPASVMRL